MSEPQPHGANPRRGLRRLGSWVASNLLAFLTLLGVLWYALTTVSFSAFYVELGLEPSEVGITYVDTLVRAVAALLPLLLLWAAFLLAWIVATLCLAALELGWRRLQNKPKRARELGFLQDFASGLVNYALVILVVTIPFFLWPETSRDLADDVQNGEALTPAFFSRSNPLGLRAQHARITWVGESPPADLESLADKPLLYLGEGDGMLVLFNASTDQALRVPSGAVVLSLSN